MELSGVKKKLNSSKVEKINNELRKREEEISVKRVKRSKVRRKTDKELDKEATQVENVSIFLIVLMVVLCCIVGIVLGVYLYKLAINSSNAIIISRLVSNLLF